MRWVGGKDGDILVLVVTFHSLSPSQSVCEVGRGPWSMY